ncbi:hypothetical protein [Pedobacter sp. UC225_65]|uniref:hypothetical protein n=1 Tax=Pedobacter sp. UC225_65 TaxID=3350173 RepID=UPI0036717405
MKKTNLLSKAEMKKVLGGNGGCSVYCPMGDACCDAHQSGGPICGCTSTMLEILHLARLHLVIVTRAVYKDINSNLPKYKKAGFVILPFYINFA